METSNGSLSLADFETIITALDILARKHIAPEDFMGEVFSFVKRGGEDPDKIDPSILQAKIDEKINEKKLYQENVKLLQARFITMKRFLLETAPVDWAYNILSQSTEQPPKPTE